jgi:CoA:oxalate CoA-transferase
MFAAFGIVSALYQRQKTKAGQKIDIGMLDCQFAFLKPYIENYLNLKIITQPVGNRHPLVTPFGVFRTKDGQIVICAGNQRLWEKLCEILGCENLLTDELFIDNACRTKNHKALQDILEEITITKTTGEWLSLLTKAGIPVGTINTIKDVCRLTHIRQRNMIKKLYHPRTGIFKTSGIPVKMSGATDELSIPAPLLGEHTAMILKKYFNLSEEEIAELREKEVIK